MKSTYQEFHCEVCGQFTEANYYSLEDCNQTGFGVCLCKRCYDIETKKKEGNHATVDGNILQAGR